LISRESPLPISAKEQTEEEAHLLETISDLFQDTKESEPEDEREKRMDWNFDSLFNSDDEN